ncbi:hypothetical protein V490_08539 [Pseudogymnoascus sp. VKM F-3557]|nr:hypothetical protein V490_08539 [Pseudogymnoascus sp. VKM F-3557]
MALPPSNALVRRRTDTELMPPPPKRIKRPQKVLDEEAYTDGISHIIARDFFPGLLESETQSEYLDALDSKDQAWISSAGRRLAHVMTPGRKRGRRGTSIQTRSGSETPIGYAGDTPMSVVSDVSATSTQADVKEEVDTNMSLDAFQSKYTSEDNESFYKLLDKQNKVRAEKYAWMWRGNKLPSKQMLKQKEVETKLLKSGQSLVDDGGERQRLAIQDVGEKPAMADGWKSRPDNNFMFGPEGVEDSIETVAQRAQTASKAAPKGVVYNNTRMPGLVTVDESQVPPSPSLSAIQDAIAGRPRPTDSEPGYTGSETPRVNGYAFVDEDEPEPEERSQSSPAILLGKGDATPNPFKIKEHSKREGLHHRMVDRVARMKRASSQAGMTGRVEKTPVPKFPSSPRVGSGGLTPAAQRLWSRVGKSGASSPGFGNKTPGTARSKSTNLKINWTPNTMAGRRLLDAAALFNASRGVARKHVALRQEQFDRFTKTSSIAKAVKSEAARYTETARAASFLASRLNEDKPQWASEAEETNAGDSAQKGAPHPGPEGAEPRDARHVVQKEASTPSYPDGTIPPTKLDFDKLERDRSILSKEATKAADVQPGQPIEAGTHSPENHLTSEEARRLQRSYENQIPSYPADGKADTTRNGTANGFDNDSSYKPLEHNSPILSSLPRVKVPKHSSNVQANDAHLKSQDINSDSYSSPIQTSAANPVEETDPLTEEDGIPQGINTAIFSSSRVAKSLGGRTHTNVRSSEKVAPQNTPTQILGETTSNATQQSSSATSGVESLSSETVLGQKDEDPLVKIIAEASAPKALYEMRESKVPSSRMGRLWNYGGLAAGMVGGAIGESLRRATGSGGEGSFMLSAGNMDRLVAKLSRMRGAALKMGQMLSFQDSKMLPGPIQEVLLRVQDNADYMPASQRNKVLAADLGPDWRDLFDTFDEKPIAAASIGQVHTATLKSTGERVAVKVQYPGVADSIDSDLSNLAVLLTASRLLPKGLFLDKTIANARIELGWECDYIREAQCGRRFQEYLADETDTFIVPRVIPEASGKQVITMEFMDGVGVTKVKDLTQEQRNWIGTNILRLCLREITEFRFMQTDPNWTNFLFNAEKNKLELLDFGASREYPEEFITTYTQLLNAASKSDTETVRRLSVDLGYLTGHESKPMVAAHIASVMTLAEPFLATSPEVYDFRDQTITERVKDLIPLMIKERLAPPPEETYSLHRKLSGAFLLCARLGSQVRCRELFVNSMNKGGYN